MRSEIEQLEIKEQQKHLDEREKKISKAMEKVLAKQYVEMAALKKKLVN